MAEFHVKNFGDPDEVVELPGLRDSRVDVGDFTVSRGVYEPGWRWSAHVRPTVAGEWCQVRHVGLMVSGRFGMRFSDGATADVYEIPPGHDGYVIGHEPVEVAQASGLRFEDRGTHTLKGIAGEWYLHAYVGDAESSSS